MYADDSFFSLPVIGQYGLAALSLALSIATCWLTWKIGRGRPIWIRLALALLAFWLFIWLSPQIYYHYYMLFFPDLPWQIVVKPPPGPGTVAELMGFQARENLANHSRGILAWLLVVLALVGSWRETRAHQRDWSP